MAEDEDRGSDEDNEEEESIIMSQPVWNEDDLVEEGERYAVPSYNPSLSTLTSASVLV